MRHISSGVVEGDCCSFGDRGLMQEGSTRSLCPAEVTHSGRLDLRELRHRKICHYSCRINLILVIVRMVKRCDWSAIKLMALAGLRGMVWREGDLTSSGLPALIDTSLRPPQRCHLMLDPALVRRTDATGILDCFANVYIARLERPSCEVECRCIQNYFAASLSIAQLTNHGIHSRDKKRWQIPHVAPESHLPVPSQ
jgi:hypothetical protein